MYSGIIYQTTGLRSLRIWANLQDFCRTLQIWADSKNRPTQKHNKIPHSDVKRKIKLFKSREKSHLCQNDENFFCRNLYKNFTELSRSIENPECWTRCPEMHIPCLVTLELKCGCSGTKVGHWSKCNGNESASGTQLVRRNLGSWRCSKSGLLFRF